MVSNIANEVAKRALAFQERMQERIKKELDPGIGYENVDTRHIRNVIKKAMTGNLQAEMEVTQLAEQNGHQDGEPYLCPVCVEIQKVMGDNAKES